MRRCKMLFGAAVALVVLLAAVPGHAIYIVEGDWVKLSAGTGHGYTSGTIMNNGGQFVVDIQGRGTAQDFVTFCVERNENINFVTQYQVDPDYGLEDYVVKGGGGATGNKDYLSPGTKYVFYRFATNTLPGYTDDPAHAAAVQYVIWGLEEELTLLQLETYLDSLPGDPFSGVEYWARELYDFASGMTSYDPLYSNVKAMNLVIYDQSGNKIDCQSQLVLVPEPMTISLLGLGLLGVGIAARRIRKRA